MLRVAFPEVFGAVFLGVTLSVCPAAAQDACADGALGDVPVPGGLHDALQAAGEVTADRSQFLSELIRSTQSAAAPAASRGSSALTSLLAFLDAAAPSEAKTLDPRTETLPLPLPPARWLDTVFNGRVTPDHLLAAILRSRDASLLYYGLLALDDGTRAWLCGRPALLADVASHGAARFVLAAPALRVAGGTVRVPGGEATRKSWEALVGAPAGDPEAFLRALLAHSEGRLAFFFGAMGPLEPAQARFALGTHIADTLERLAAAEQLFAVFRRISQGWEIDRRPFRRPTFDPALLAGDLGVDADGRPVLPGTRRFWTLVLDESAPRERDLDSSATYTGAPVDFAWLCDRVFGADARRRQGRYYAVLYASRLAPRFRAENAGAAVLAVRAAVEFPALAMALERAHVDDPAVVARVARRAGQVAASGNPQQAGRAIAQFQGLLAVVVRAAARGALPRPRVAELVSSLSAVESGERGDYEGRLVRWAEANLDANGAGGLEARLRSLVAGEGPAPPRFVDWEGTRYRLDLAHAEESRVSHLLGPQRPPPCSSAATLVSIADALVEPRLTLPELQRAQAELAQVAGAVDLERGGLPKELTDRLRAAASALDHAARNRDIASATRIARPLRVLADDLLAHGLVELVYAAALGQPDRDWIAARDLADRHDFLLRPIAGHAGAWDPPSASVNQHPGLGVGGSLLGLDVVFAEFALVRVSSRPPVTRPTLADVNRRALVETVALVEPAALNDDDRDTIASGIRHGRERAAAIRTAHDAAAVAHELRLGAVRSSLLPWLATHDAPHVPRFFSRRELLQLGVGFLADESSLHAWGAPARARLGCLCLRVFGGSPERLLGRPNSGVLMSVVPDLNLRLAELLAEMRMPATLLAPVLASATLDLVNTAPTRDEDDRRGLTAFIDELGQDRLEQYLALLTSDGPLVPIEEEAAVPTEVQR